MNLQRAGVHELSLSEALRERTSALHTEAERSGVINDILRRKTDQRAYAILLRNLLPAYSQMEQSLRSHSGSPALQPFARPDIYRAERIVADLTALCGDGWESDLPLFAAADRYAAAVAAAGEGDGIRLIAHAYVRYFGDLSGGQVLKRLLSTSLGIGPQALSVYDFPGIADLKTVKDQMRSAIDGQGTDSANGEAIIQEGIRAFQHNIEISRAVQEDGLRRLDA